MAASNYTDHLSAIAAAAQSAAARTAIAQPAQPDGGRSATGLALDGLPPEAQELLGMIRPAISDELAALPTEPEQAAAGSLPEPVLSLAIGKSARSSQIEKRGRAPFSEFVRMVRVWPLNVGKQTYAEHQRLKAGTPAEKARAAVAKDTGWYSWAQFAKPVRAAENVITVSGFIGDFDDGSLTWEQVSAPLGDCTHLITSTCSHHPDAPRWRLHVPYNRAVSPEEHARLFDYFVSLYPAGAVDTSTRDPSRLWFGPGCWSDTMQYREIHEIPGTGFFDPDAALQALAGADVLPAQPATPGPHPNDALAAGLGYERPSSEQVQRMLAHIQLEDAAGRRRGPWLKVLQGVHAWADGSEEGLQLVAGWSSTQPGYIDEDDVRRVWDSCRGRGVTIASVIAMAVEGGYTHEAVEAVVDGMAAAVLPAISTVPGDWLSPVPPVPAIPFQTVDGFARYLKTLYIYIELLGKWMNRRNGGFYDQGNLDRTERCWAPPRCPRPSQILTESFDRPKADAVAFFQNAPDIFRDVIHGRPLAYANIAAPWRVEPIAPTPDEERMWGLYLDHLFAGPDGATARDWILDRLAALAHDDGARVPKGMLIMGAPGCGKSTLTERIAGLLFGAVGEVNLSEIGKGFGGTLTSKRIGYIPELFQGSVRDAKKLNNYLKQFITDKYVSVERKGQDAVTVVNRVTIFATSNHVHDAMFLENGDRRWFVFHTPAGPVARMPWWADFNRFLDSDRAAGVLKYILLQRDISGVDLHEDPPATVAKRRLIESSMSRLEDKIHDLVDGQRPPFDKDLFTLEDLATTLALPPLPVEISPRRLSGVLESLGIGARNLGQKRFPKGAIARIWAIRNVEHWQPASGKAVYEHLQSGKRLFEIEPASPAMNEGE